MDEKRREELKTLHMLTFANVKSVIYSVANDKKKVNVQQLLEAIDNLEYIMRKKMFSSLTEEED